MNQDLGGCRSRPFPLETGIDLKVSSTQGVERKHFTLSVQGAGRKKGSQSEGVEATGSEFGARKKWVRTNGTGVRSAPILETETQKMGPHAVRLSLVPF